MIDWKDVVWSDEAHFEALNHNNRIFVRRPQSEANELFNFVSYVQEDGSYVSVWGCIARDVRGPLIVYSGKWNGPACVNVIQESLPIFI